MNLDRLKALGTGNQAFQCHNEAALICRALYRLATTGTDNDLVRAAAMFVIDSVPDKVKIGELPPIDDPRSIPNMEGRSAFQQLRVRQIAERPCFEHFCLDDHSCDPEYKGAFAVMWREDGQYCCELIGQNEVVGATR